MNSDIVIAIVTTLGTIIVAIIGVSIIYIKKTNKKNKLNQKIKGDFNIQAGRDVNIGKR